MFNHLILKTMFEFQKLEVYKKSKLFHTTCRTIMSSNKLPKYINDQLGRASFSVALNIAEGSGKFSNADRRNFFVVSRSSVFECAAIIDILHDCDQIKTEDFNILLKMADEMSRMLYTMIRNLEQKKT